ncbi:hypothetical protein GCM10025298_08660 [Natronobiforma cellulositropha]
MDGNITGENDERVGLYVDDNNEVEHWIEIEFGGEIMYHDQSGYSDDPAKRTDEENEHVEQARRFARYHVYRERGYDTLPALEHPDNLTAAALVVGQLSLERIEAYFGDYYQQLRSHGGHTAPAVEIPAAVEERDYLFYQKDLYLGTALEEFEQFEWRDGVFQPVTDSVTDVDPASVADRAVVAVSGVHIRWLDWSATEHVVRHDEPALERDPTVRFECRPFVPDSLDSFRDALVHNLACQARDCYIGMGIAPPEEMRVQGFGTYEYYIRYQKLDSMYQPYHQRNATITDWQEATTPNGHFPLE